MRTRSSLEYTFPRRRNRRRSRHRQEAIPLILEPEIPMADDRPMAEQLQAPTGGFESVIVVPLINLVQNRINLAQNFELKSSLINLVQNRIFRGGNDEERFVLLFPFSLDGVAKTWLDKEPPNSILTWDDLVSKFINFFFPPSKTTNLRNEITNFRQIAQESFSEAWERFKELLRKCPHHGFSLMHQLDTFYNSLSYNDQDSLNSAAGGNFLYKSPTEGRDEQDLAEEKFLKIKQVVEEEQTQPEYLQELLQSLLKDLQILNEIQPLKQEISNQIQKDQEEKRIAELLAEERLQKANQALNESQSPQEMRIQDLEIQKQQCLEEMKEWMNDLGIREYQKEEIDIDYRRKCEDKIYELKDKFNGLSIEIRKIIQEAEELRESEARARIQKIIIDDDDDDLGFYAVEIPCFNPSESDDFSLGECNLFDIDDSYYEKSTSRLAHLAPISPEIVEVCVDDDDTDDDDDYDDDVYVDDCVDIEEDGGEIDLDISKIVDISLREKLVESYLLIEKINILSLSPPIPISPIFCPSSTIPVVDLDLPLEEADVPSFSDDSMILPKYESFTFDDEPVMAEVNVFDEINTSELSYPGIGENVVLDEEEDTFTFTTRSFLPFVTYPEVLPASYSTGSEDKIFNPGILDVFDPLHPPLMDFHVTKAFSGFTFSLLKIFSKKFFEPGNNNATVFRILEDSWFNIVEEQSNAHNFH
ncbi:reverse transcriptase domain-containing protein [Tanacetum coccineum]